MAQHDMNIANQGFPAFRSDLNDALAALVSNSSGATAPSTTFAHQIWVDTAADPSVLKIRNADNDAWITIGSLNQTDDKFKLTPADGVSTDTISELTSAAGVTIDGVLLKDSGVVVADGSASAPTVTNTGDTNTGLYFPAADEVAVAAGGSVAAAFNSHQFMGMRNRIINGDMRIDQRNAGAAVTSNGAYPVDRFAVTHSTDGAFSAQQDSSAPTGFVNSIKYTTTTADGTLTGTQRLGCVQRIEGTNIADLAWGTANAKTVTLSFWVRSSLTGTFGGTFKNSANDRSYPFTYTISAADTWEYKTVTVAGDTSGTWLTTTGVGIRLEFGLGCGPDGSGTAGAWAGANYFSATGAVSVIGTLNATWYITGVQLEVGSVATPFERRPYGTELALCQRYFYMHAKSNDKTIGRGGYYTSTQVECGIPFPVTMRATPTLFSVTGTSFYVAYRNGAGDDLNSLTLAGETTNTCAAAYNSSEASGTAGHYAHLVIANANAYIGFSAEL